MHTRKIIALSLGLGIPFLIIMALVSRLFMHRHSKNDKQDIYTVDGSNAEPRRLSRKPSSWKLLFASKQKDENSKWVPTLSGVIKAGDEGLWSSALFTNPHGHPGEISFDAICEMFANELRSRSMTERFAYSVEIGKFLNSAKQGAPGPRRAQSLSYMRTNVGRGDMAPLAKRKSLDISVVEKGLGRSLSIKRPAAVLVPMGNGLAEQDNTSNTQRTWMKEGRPAEYYHGRMSVRITSAELAMLSVILGSSITNGAGANIDRGAFGISLWSTSTDDGRYQVSLRQHKRSISQMPSSGSGHSPTFAKHLACGCLPMSQDAKSVNSVLITDEAFETIRSGAPFTVRKRSQQTAQAKFLAALPSSREPSFHAIEPSTKSGPSTPLIDAIALLPFTGGLVPLASAPLIKTIQFVASGGQHPGRLLQRLEGLVDKVQRHSPSLTIFGPLHSAQNTGLLFRERERLGKLATGDATEALADKVARVQRYTTLLERLMALIPDTKPQDVLAAVKEATKKEMQRSYADAVAAATSPLRTALDAHSPVSDARTSRKPPSSSSSSSSPPACRSPCPSLASASSGSEASRPGCASAGPGARDLGKQVEGLLKAELPLSVEQVAAVARLVCVAWTRSVGVVAWGQEEEGWRVPGLEGRDGILV